MRDLSALLARVATLAMFSSSQAPAQETEPAAPQPYVDSGDIIVTARKRQESILKVPVVQSVLTAETLANNQVVDVRGITPQVAGGREPGRAPT